LCAVLVSNRTVTARTRTTRRWPTCLLRRQIRYKTTLSTD
ncbi:hypothetical protein T11_7262, partial [Trichinella zimbabwensis]